MLKVVTNEQLDQEAAIALAEEEATNYEQETLDGIAGHITKAWEAARTSKQTLARERILDAQRSRRGEYSAEKLAAIRKVSGGSEEFGRIVSNKCRIAEAWLRDVYLGQVEPAWVLASRCQELDVVAATPEAADQLGCGACDPTSERVAGSEDSQAHVIRALYRVGGWVVVRYRSSSRYFTGSGTRPVTSPPRAATSRTRRDER